MAHDMHWDDLAYFVCLVDTQTLTACADKMGVQHSTVARRIEHLEHSLSVNLFDRLGKRYTLTHEGRLLYEQAIEVQKEVRTFERMAIDQNALQGKVTLSVPPVWANEVLVPALPDFHQRFPDISLSLCGEVGMSNLHQREADIALRTRRPIEEDLVIRRLGATTYRFYAHRDWLEQPTSSPWPLIAFEANSRVWAWAQMLIQQHDCPIALHTNDLYMACHAARQQIGIALLPDFLARSYPELIAIDPIQRSAVTAWDIDEAQAHASGTCYDDLSTQHTPSSSDTLIPLAQAYPLYLVMHPDVRRSARVRAVADWLIECSTQLTGFT